MVRENTTPHQHRQIPPEDPTPAPGRGAPPRREPTPPDRGPHLVASFEYGYGADFSRRNAVIDETVSRLRRPNASSEESGTAATLVFGSMSPSGLVLAPPGRVETYMADHLEDPVAVPGP